MYQIAWDDAAIDGLAMLSLLYQSRWADINSAVDLIEYRLHRFPMAYGREVSEDLWRIDADPISITFTISGQDVIVESIGWVG
jgi:hypothetical protein